MNGVKSKWSGRIWGVWSGGADHIGPHGPLGTFWLLFWDENHFMFWAQKSWKPVHAEIRSDPIWLKAKQNKAEQNKINQQNKQ